MDVEDRNWSYEIYPETNVITVRPLGEGQRVIGVIRGIIMKLLMYRFGDYHAIVRFISKYDVKRIVGLNPYCSVISDFGQRHSCCKGNGDIYTFMFDGIIYEFNPRCNTTDECMHGCINSIALLYVLRCLGVNLGINRPYKCKCSDICIGEDSEYINKCINIETVELSADGYNISIHYLEIEDGRHFINCDDEWDDDLTLQSFVGNLLYREPANVIFDAVYELSDSGECTKAVTGYVDIGDWYEYYDEFCHCSVCFSIRVLLRYRLRALTSLNAEENMLLR
jgi:hypothetical protein